MLETLERRKFNGREQRKGQNLNTGIIQLDPFDLT